MGDLLKMGILPVEHGSCMRSDVAVEGLLIIVKHTPEGTVARVLLKRFKP
jgi:hypothetical protein